MKSLPLSMLFGLAVAAEAQAAEPIAAPLSVRDALPNTPSGLNIRLVGDQGRPVPVADSGMIASTTVAPNAKLGIGLLKTRPRRSDDWRIGTRYGGSRKAAVNFQLKF